MSDHVPGPDGRCVCHARWRDVYEGWQRADGSASPVPNVRVYAADSACVVPGVSCCEGES